MLPAIPGVAVPTGIGLFQAATIGKLRYPPGPWLLATALGVLLATAAFTVIPAMPAARRAVADTVQST